MTMDGLAPSVEGAGRPIGFSEHYYKGRMFNLSPPN